MKILLAYKPVNEEGDIEKLVKPIIDKKADVVVGCRPVIDHPEFNIIEKLLQISGSWVLRKILNPDAGTLHQDLEHFQKKHVSRYLFILIFHIAWKL